jgi:hypothetical protein
MSNDLVTQYCNEDLLEKVVIGGDLKALSSQERILYYNKTCESLGLNPLTRPFEYLNLNGKLTLYARKDATEQLRKLHHISITEVTRETLEDGIYACTAYAETKDGRKDVAIGAVSIVGLKGDAKSNALMKAESKAKRRVTLSLAGLGMVDETEVESIPNATTAIVIDDYVSQDLIDQHLKAIEVSTTLEELKKAFTDAHKSNLSKDHLTYNLVVKAKDKRKLELEDKQLVTEC